MSKPDYKNSIGYNLNQFIAFGGPILLITLWFRSLANKSSSSNTPPPAPTPSPNE